MELTGLVSVGVDGTSGRTFTYAALDRDLKLFLMMEAELDELIAFLVGLKSVIVAVNSPSHVSAGLVKRRLAEQNPDAHAFRGTDLRTSEYDLRLRRISIGGTPSNAALCPAWVQLGFALYQELRQSDFQAYPAETAGRQWLETHPHAAFTVLLGCAPLPKPTLEGRLQRALVLYERGLKMRDPMVFLEEITRHRLLHGILPTDVLLAPQQLDALVAAYTAWLAAFRPADTTALGSPQEGFLTLPAAELQESY